MRTAKKEARQRLLSSTMDRADAAVCGQLYNTLIRAVGVELKVREQEEILERVAELEALMQQRQEGRGGA